MTTQEINLYFPHSKEDELEELYEDNLFEYKQFFIQRAPISTVFEAKLKKLMRMHDAYCALTGSEFSLHENKLDKFNFSEDVLEAFNSYQAYRNSLKNDMLQAADALHLKQVIENVLRLTKAYMKLWPDVEASQQDGVIMSKEPDPMELLVSIREFNKKGGFTFADLGGNTFQIPSVLLMEMKRLSLLRKKEENE